MLARVFAQKMARRAGVRSIVSVGDKITGDFKLQPAKKSVFEFARDEFLLRGVASLANICYPPRRVCNSSIVRHRDLAAFPGAIVGRRRR